MDYNQVKELIAIVDQSSLREFNITMDNVSLFMSKNSSENQKTLISVPEANVPVHTVTEPLTILPEDEPAEVTAGNLVTSPIVGVFYDKPSPDRPPFKAVGDKVSEGEVLCIIEAMKVMNEVISPYTGVIAEVMAQDGREVEYGQPLFHII